jgi:hypothetical protein
MNVAVPLNPALVCVENETGVLSKAVELRRSVPLRDPRWSRFR